jgi:GNAT superfamily N-acetyltransferase
MTKSVSHVEIRPAVPADAEAIRSLTRAAYAKWVALIGREPLPMQADYERAVAEHTVDLLIADGALAGVLETILRPDHLWIENAAVAPERQGRGYGRLLLARAEKRATRPGGSKFDCRPIRLLRPISRFTRSSPTRSTASSHFEAGCSFI